MNTAGFVVGILALIIFFIALIPCIGALNWLNIPFAILGLILNIVAIAQSNSAGTGMGKNVAGAIMCGVAIVFGGFRLLLGGGIF
jgi:hypothetical protein